MKSPYTHLQRRMFLASAGLLLFNVRSALSVCQKPDDDSAEVIARSKEVGLSGFKTTANDSYVAIGDASEAFRSTAIDLCLGLSKDFLKHFGGKGFSVARPEKKMTLVTLGSRASFAAFLGGDPGGAIGGLYDLDTNRLVMFDNRAPGGLPNAERLNSVSLFHEATHQLTFNCGMLTRDGDVPLAVSEGLAMYGEVRRPKGITKIGDPNPERLAVIAPPGTRRDGVDLTPAIDMIADDNRFHAPATEQMAYAEGWLLIAFLLKSPTRLPSFRQYLTKIATRRDPSHRRQDWEDAFGNQEKFERERIAHFRKLK